MESFDRTWEKVHREKEWGKYPPEELIRFIARNYYKKDRNKIHILEIGCGTGANLWYLSREKFNSYGIDGSQTAVNKAKERLESENLKSQITVGDVSSIDYENEKFDCVVDIQCVVHNKIEGIKKIYKEVYRVLKNEGKFFSMSFSTETLGCGLGEKIEENTYTNITKGPLSGVGTVHFFTEDELINYLTEVGFKNIKIDYIETTHENQTVKIKSWIVQAQK
ncbi:class I SAM-dependent methyltransferase [Tepidibacter formicigenes]|jgi:ubiquinone/menaquinone biosynthesis C-methylase UbiE|uniref:Methyltransferase domain-containing protein n=1 Tax=Tepidibacter formicigenes DSM 15518 TaxID=1123349 RepID=A0A1M6P071_9FIRM|nr:class I SAM-dependent methyltransferase [Tepidibacter formicigenes]SHK01304.1 Methyltransferase domain-containing protein [Tepidibacter formicigenes DSM 15518]